MNFSAGVFPDQLKLAGVITLHKKGSADNPSNYRPISLLFASVNVFRKPCTTDFITFLKQITYPILSVWPQKETSNLPYINQHDCEDQKHN